MMKLLEAPPTSAFSALLQGLIKPSLFSLIVTCLAALAITGNFLSFAKPEFIANHSEFLATYDGDDDIHITATVLNLQLEEAPPPSIYIVGDSALREVILETDLALNLQQSDKNFRIVDLRSGRQSLLESLAIIDNIKDDAQGLIILGVSARSLIISKEIFDSAASGKRRGFTSKAVAEFLTKENQKSFKITGIYGLDNIHFLLPRYLRLKFKRNRKKIQRVTHQHKDQIPMSPDNVAVASKRYLQYLFGTTGDYESNAERGLAILNTIDKTIKRKKNLSLLLVEKPLNPLLVENYLEHDFIKNYRNQMKALSNSIGADYLIPAENFKLSPLDFADLVHVTGGTTANQYTSLIAEYLLNELK